MLEGKTVNITKGGDFDPVPMDSYTAQIADVNLVTQFNQFQGKEEDVLNYQFVILDEKEMPAKEGEVGTTRGRFLWRRCRPSLNSKSWLGKLAKAVYGRDLTKDEIDNFDPESLVGKQVRVSVEQAESKDGQRIFNNIVSFGKVLKTLEPIEIEKAKAFVERSSAPVTAPEAEDPESFIKGMAEDAETAELEAKLAVAKAKAAKAKA